MSKVVKKGYREEAAQGYNLRTAMEEATRCLVCYDAPCSKACPAGTDPAKFIRSLKFKNVKGAVETIRSNNPLAGSCAKVCPYDRLCQEACSRCGIDKPIQIGRIQSYLVEQEKAFDMKINKAPDEKKAARVACIGAGPASLACAAEMAKAGYQVTVFEREAKAGGVLTYGIVPSRLPQEVVDYDVELIADLGVEFKFNTEVKAGDLDSYDAVFVGTGLWAANIPEIEGADLKGVYSAIEFLKEAREKGEGFDPGRTVAVVGGGDVAVDCAVTAKLLGAEDVRILYRRSIEEAPAEMTELEYALKLGIGITTGFYPVAAVGEGRLQWIEAAGFRDASAKMKLSVDTLVFATGQKAEDQKAVADVKLTDKGTIAVDDNGSAGGGIFAAGDIVNGGQTVVEAVAEAKKAAAAMIEYLEEKGVK
ncbi:MAG TPA: FAD-dependent oxidoreductase [Candidatus Copromorpha excrementigallinarum]|uniref:dihydrouracil dehydrogenase (NAD(+)) n=1 Tax=Candidatus Allocopromorpha excrementigallinarum TaxID=2840742 RepID=A0A9D1I1R3_9FIRM|nr:FAD-dependent oxidoreductase [Candidatus Copromorpha excrementigallinarum]